MQKHQAIPKDFSENLIAQVENKVLEQLENEEKKIDQTIEDLTTIDRDTLETIRQRRIKELEAKRQAMKNYKQLQHGIYTEIYSEREFFDAAKKSKKLIVHFYRPSTWRCEIVDKHLQMLSEKQISIKCVKFNAEKSPFFAERFKIWCIPTIMLIKNGSTSHSIIGFDELGGDGFSYKNLEDVLREHNMISEDDQ